MGDVPMDTPGKNAFGSMGFNGLQILFGIWSHGFQIQAVLMNILL